MEYSSSYYDLDLSSLLTELKSPEIYVREFSIKQIASYLNLKRIYSDEVITKITDNLSVNLEVIPGETLISLIDNLFKVLQENSISVTFYLNKIFPLLLLMVFRLNLDKTQFDLVTSTFGNLIKLCGVTSSQIIENQFKAIFENFSNEENFKFEFSKYALINCFTELIKNSPVISYNQIIDYYGLFKEIIENYKNPKEHIRIAIMNLIKEYLLLLGTRDKSKSGEKLNDVYMICINKIKTEDVNEANVVHGIILVLEAFCQSKEFLDNDKFEIAMNFLSKKKNHKNNKIKIAIMKVLPIIAELNNKKFEQNYSDSINQFYIALYSSKSSEEIKGQILIYFGKLCTILSFDNLKVYLSNIISFTKKDLKNNPNNFNIKILDFLALILKADEIKEDKSKTYFNYLSNEFPFSEIVDTMFNCGFYESHVNYLTTLLSIYEDDTFNNSFLVMNIIIVILNVISVIISDRKFVIRTSIKNFINFDPTLLSPSDSN
ncbi:MAG: hypothetical protein MJ252_10335, partial [archaeon]|nr:hypothetical protein [archaeon]